MPVATSPNTEAVDYRYFVCDLMSNELLAEIPFRSVSYSRSLTEPGTMSADIAVTEDTYNLSLYENTLPGKTAIYVMRNDVCVWGGIIWGRTYSLVDKIVSISAAEFTSYLAHRVVWKTWNSAYEATAVVTEEEATITLSFGQYDFSVGEAVFVDWGRDYAKYSGYFVVESVSSNGEGNSVITVLPEYADATGTKRPIPVMVFGEESPITVETRQDTYKYASDLLRELTTDLFDFEFANDEIRPGIDIFNEIKSVARASNVVTVVTEKKHELVAGQRLSVTDVEVDANFDNSRAIVKAVVTDNTFTYENTGNTVSTTLVAPLQKTVSAFKRSGNIATYTTTTEHLLGINDIVYIDNVSETFDGYFTVYTTPTPTTFTVVMLGANIQQSFTEIDSVTAPPYVKRRAAITYGTFGEHTTLGDIGFDLSLAATASGKLESNPVIRGFELKTVAEIFEDYSTKPNGFEYRVDCVYDSQTNSFKKYFKFLPLIPQTLTDWLEEEGTGYTGPIPVTAYGADRLIFEYPGNVLEAQFEENADDSATRFFVQGKLYGTGGNSDASQPYSGASNHKLLNQGWPILDAVDDLDSEDETVLWKQAARLLEESVPPTSTFSISVNGSAQPLLGTYSPGDWCSIKLNDVFVDLRAQSYLEQDYGSDNGALVRKIVSYSVSVPDSPGYPEKVDLELIIEPSIPISGINVVGGKVLP
jgi:hypothetical protein